MASLLLLLATDVVVFRLFWAPTNIDLNDYTLKWYAFIVRHGFSAYAAPFSNYTPPYLYLLGLGTLAGGWLPPATVIRGLSVACNAIAAMAVFRLLRHGGDAPRRALGAACAFFLLPELVVNSAVWGQCDIIYTLFLIGCVHFAIEGREGAAAAMLGTAFAFKLQAIFLGPFVLYLLLSRQLRWRFLLLVPVIYAAWMLPAALAGRPWYELLTIYLNQSTYFSHLSMAAPNPYLIVRALLHDSPRVDRIGTAIGLVIGAMTALALAAAFLRSRQTPRRERMLLMATLSLAAMAYVLPKMHERYFFPSGAMAFLLATERPAAWPVVLLIQAADVAAYTGYLQVVRSHVLLAGAFAMMTVAITLLIAMLLERRAAEESAQMPAIRAAAERRAF